jgi:hypothetical protein
MSDLSVPTSTTDAPNAEAIQLPGDGNSSASVTYDTAENGPHRVEIVALDQLTPYIKATPGPIPRGRSNRSLRASASLASTVPS